MPIKNKDGTDFKLRGPNPLMKEQELWDATLFVLHNMKFKPVVSTADTAVTPVKTDFKVCEDPKVEAPEQTIVGPIIESTSEPKIVQGPRPDLGIKLIPCHCLPAEIKVHIDPLYGDSKKSFVYDSKQFTFEFVMIDQTDMDMRIWTTISHIGVGSIIYPQNSDRRWWRIQSKTSMKGGWLYDCVISDYQPPFRSDQQD